MKTLVCGEGATDYGREEYPGKWENGPVQVLIEKTSPIPLEITNIKKQGLEIKDKKLQRSLQGLKGHGQRALKLSHRALDIGHRCAIYYVDADKNSGESGGNETQCKRRFEAIYQEIEEGFSRLSKIIGIPMVSLKMIECWLLSDEGAFETAFGAKPTNPLLPHRPELIWGDEADKDSNHPKNVMERVLRQYKQSRREIGATREVFKEIAEHSNIDVLCEKCPISFNRFRQDIQKLLKNVEPELN